jgi:hypothetical protein
MPCSTARNKLQYFLTSYRQACQEACFHLIDLMKIDWHGGLSCRCARHWHTADAIAIGMQLKHCLIERPHETEASNSRVAGNTLQTRLFVVQPAIRQKLLLFGSSTGGGLTPADYQLLKDSVSALPEHTPARTPLLLLQSTETAGNRNLLAVEPWRRILHSLGSTAPADQLLPIALCGIVDALLAGSMLSIARERSLQQQSPLLYAALRPSLGAAPRDLHGFLAALQEVGVMQTTSLYNLAHLTGPCIAVLSLLP